MVAEDAATYGSMDLPEDFGTIIDDVAKLAKKRHSSKRDRAIVQQFVSQLAMGESLVISGAGCFEISDDETYTTVFAVKGQGEETPSGSSD